MVISVKLKPSSVFEQVSFLRKAFVIFDNEKRTRKNFSGKIKVQNGCILTATILTTKSSFESMKNKNWKSNWSNFKPIYFLHSLRVRGGFEKKSLNSTSISWQHMTTIWKHTFFGLKNLN